MATKNSRSLHPYVRITSAANGDALKAHAIRNVINSCQSILATGRHHFSVWLAPRIVAGGLALTDKAYYTKITPGPNASYLQVVLLVQPVSAKATLQVIDDSTNAVEIPAGVESNVVSALEEILFEYSVTGGTELDFYCVTDGDYLIKGITVTDSPVSLLESGDTGYVDLAAVRKGQEVTTTMIQGMITCQETVLSDLRKVHVNAAAFKDSDPLEIATPPTSYANFFDTTLTSYAQSTAPGFWIRVGASYWGDRATRLRCRVKAASSSGTGYLKFIASGSVESGELAIVAVGTPAWYETTINVATPYNYQNSYSDKIELHCKDATPLSPIQIYNIIIEEMDGLT